MKTEAEISASAKPEPPFSNHSEYEYWANRTCYRRVQDSEEYGCPILGVALLGQWPTEWTRRTHNWTIGDASGSYEVVDTCTEFKQRPDDGPDDDEPTPPGGPGPVVEEMPGQVDIFELFAEQAIDAFATTPKAVKV